MEEIACSWELIEGELCKRAVVVAEELGQLVLESGEEQGLTGLNRIAGEVLVSLELVLEEKLMGHQLHNHQGNIFENSEQCCLGHRSPQACTNSRLRSGISVIVHKYLGHLGRS